MHNKQLADRAQAEFDIGDVVIETMGDPMVEVFMDGVLVMRANTLNTFGIMGNNEHVSCTVHTDGTALCWEWSPDEQQLLTDTERKY